MDSWGRRLTQLCICMHIYICRSTNNNVSIIHNTIHPSQRKVKGKGKVGRWGGGGEVGGRRGRRGRRGISDLDKYCGEVRTYNYVTTELDHWSTQIYILCAIISPMICTFSFMYVHTYKYNTCNIWGGCIGIGLQFWNMYCTLYLHTYVI